MLELAPGSAGIDLAGLPARKTAANKCLLAGAMKRATAVYNERLARCSDIGQPATADQGAGRFVMTDRGRK